MFLNVMYDEIVVINCFVIHVFMHIEILEIHFPVQYVAVNYYSAFDTSYERKRRVKLA